MRRQSRADRAIGRIESATWLDGATYVAETALSRPAQIAGRPAAPVANALHGTRWGHPVHPMLVTVPIGTWTFALGMDLLALLGLVRRGPAEHAARTALGAGAAAAVAAASAGLADWQHTNGADRRVGAVHALINSTALGLNLVSLALRRRGRLPAGRLASAAAWGFMAVGGYLGGHLVYRRRVGTDRADRSQAGREWTAVARLGELAAGRPHRAELWDAAEGRAIEIALVREGGRIYALGARCAHQGGRLDQGWVLDGQIVCPWHGSRFDLATGRPMSGPATCPQPAYAVRVRGDVVEIRRQPEAADEPVPGQELPEAAPAAQGRLATDLLTEHHNLIRGLFRAIEAMPGHDPQRRDLLRTLATELDIHEHIEDKIFYPAVQPVSPDVALAHAEHRQLTDLLAETLKLNTASAEFDAHLKALHEAVNHHAGSEESSMFRHAERLGERRLRELGAAMEAMMERERHARFRQAWLALKVRLLEGV